MSLLKRDVRQWWLQPAKTRLVDLRGGKESFTFLGCTLRKKRSIQRNPRLHFTQRWPSPKAMKELRARKRELTSKQQSAVQSPTQATPGRSSLSRVPENGTHGLKGDAMETGQLRRYRAIIEP
jgi:hypothetical protein